MLWGASANAAKSTAAAEASCEGHWTMNDVALSKNHQTKQKLSTFHFSV